MSDLVPTDLRGEVVTDPHQLHENDQLFAVDTSEYPPTFLARIAVRSVARFASGIRYFPVTVTYANESMGPRDAYIPADSSSIHLHDLKNGPGDGVGVIMPPRLGGVRFYRVRLSS
jgi:hypothetical protein